MDYSGKVILCTGATGFIGQNLVPRLLSKGATVITIDPMEIETSFSSELMVYKGRIEDHSLVAKIATENHFDYVIHLAATATILDAFENPHETFVTNIQGTWNLLESFRRLQPNIKGFIHISTDKVYGEGKVRPYEEEDAIEARHIYDISKAGGDFIARGYFYNYGLPVLVARFCNVYGPNDLNWSRLIPGTIRHLYENTPPTVNMFLDANNKRIPFRRDFIHVDDIVQGLELMLQAAERKKHIGEVFNFGTGQCHAVNDIVTLISDLYGKKTEPDINIVPTGEIFSQCMSYEKAKRLLGFIPQISLEVGLHETVEWYRNYLVH